MAKRKTTTKTKRGGPFLSAAFFCEKAIEDKQDGALSAIRIIDTLTIQLHHLTPPDVPSDEKRLPVNFSGVVSFKSGDGSGSHKVSLVVESPTGKKSGKLFEQSVLFPVEPQGGFNLKFGGVIEIKNGGVFWVHVFLDGRRVTQMPLMINVERLPAPLGTSDKAGSPALFP